MMMVSRKFMGIKMFLGTSKGNDKLAPSVLWLELAKSYTTLYSHLNFPNVSFPSVLTNPTVADVFIRLVSFTTK